MASKVPSTNTEHIVSRVPCPLPSALTLDTVLLGSAIPLEPHTRICYRAFTSSSLDASQCAQYVEAARQSIVAQKAQALVESLLPSTYVSGTGSATLFVFALETTGTPSEAVSKLQTAVFGDLTGSKLASFTPGQVYPCSDACALLHEPCPRCQESAQGMSNTPPSAATPRSRTNNTRSAACLLPRKPLRNILVHFLDAVRCRLIDDISERAASDAGRTPIRRLQDGFLLGPSPRSSEWAIGWQKQTNPRSLLYCQLHIRLTMSRLLIHPALRPTSYLPLELPIAQGTPITLLPFATPAYYLSTYSGPASSLTQQFVAALAGLGAGAWTRFDSGYVIAWIGVQNNQGDAKGTTVVWPTSLCVTLHPSSAAARTRAPLAHIPELPTQLQFSPPPTFSPTSPRPRLAGRGSGAGRRPLLGRTVSMTENPARALHSLALPRTKSVRSVAADVGAYVDAVARDRERRRESFRRERGSGLATKNDKASSSVTPLTPPDVSTQTLDTSVAPSVQLGAMFGELSPAEESRTEVAPPVLIGVVPVAAAPDPAPPPPAVEPMKANPSASFDPFGGFDTSWPAPGSDFMDVNMDYDLGFGTGAGTDTIGGSSSGGTSLNFGNIDGGGRMDLDFDDFTADDFNFFDDTVAPSTGVSVGVGRPLSYQALKAAPVTLESPTTALTPTTGPAPMGLSPSAFAVLSPQVAQTSPWLAAPFSPSVLKFDSTGTAALPTPQLTPSNGAVSEPPTPTVHLATRVWSTSPSTPHTPFDAIRFGPAHRLADGKYQLGKFALPSPPGDPIHTPPPSLPTSPPGSRPLSAPSAPVSWIARYHAATDPRIGIVRKLIGVKRKGRAAAFAAERDRKPSWTSGHEEWTDAIPPSSDVSDGEDQSEPESDEFEDVDMGGPDVPRPCTPPPPWLPPGPSLLCTQFNHALLLPLSTPLHSGVAALLPPPTLTPAAFPHPSVPTPVSPAAITGAALEKARSLEAAAQVLAREVVDNCVWADSWMEALPGNERIFGEVRQHDVQAVARVIASATFSSRSLTVKEAFMEDAPESEQDVSGANGPTITLPHPPSLTVGKTDAIIQVLPSALRFWEKLGLVPRAGRKDVEAYVLFEDTGEDCRLELQAWLTSVSAAYAAKNYGKHIPGTSCNGAVPGLVPIKLDTFRKEFANFIQTLPRPTAHAVLYVIIPSTISSLASPAFRQVLSLIKRAHKLEGGALFHLVPAALVRGCGPDSTPSREALDALTRCLYDRLHEPVERTAASRTLVGSGTTLCRRFQGPSFALARSEKTKISFMHEPVVRTLDVADRLTILHVGYATSPCGRWLAAACIDQRGEGHDVQVWLNPAVGEGSSVAEAQLQVVGLVWGFVREFAKKANVEWRVVIAKLGVMGEVELDAWMFHLHGAVPGPRDSASMHVFVLSVERDSAWTLADPQAQISKPTTTSTPSSRGVASPFHTKTALKDATKTLIADMSMATYLVLRRAPHTLLPSIASGSDIGEDTSFVPEASTQQTDLGPSTSHDTCGACSIGLRPVATVSLVGVPAGTNYTASVLSLHLLHSASSVGSTAPSEVQTLEDAARNFHELEVLANERWRGASAGRMAKLPFHLAALRVMLEALQGADESCFQD